MSSPRSARWASSPSARCSAPRSTTSATRAATAALARGAATTSAGRPPRGPRCRAGAATARSGPWCKTMYEARRDGHQPDGRRVRRARRARRGRGAAHHRPVPRGRPRVQGDRHRGPARPARRRCASRSPPTCPARTSPSWCTAAGCPPGSPSASRSRPGTTTGRRSGRPAGPRATPRSPAGPTWSTTPATTRGCSSPPTSSGSAPRAWSSRAWTCGSASASARPRRAATITSSRRSTSAPRSSGSRAVIPNGISGLRSPSCPSTRSAARRRASTSAKTA